MKIIHLPSGGKFYETPYGLFPSVTTVLQATMPEDQRKRLRNWYERNGSEAESLRQQAAERGKVIHKLIEARFKGERMECPPELTEFWQEARRILGAIGEVLAVEQPVYHPRLQYAGTLDLLAYWQGALTLFDFKTSHMGHVPSRSAKEPTISCCTWMESRAAAHISTSEETPRQNSVAHRSRQPGHRLISLSKAAA